LRLTEGQKKIRKMEVPYSAIGCMCGSRTAIVVGSFGVLWFHAVSYGARSVCRVSYGAHIDPDRTRRAPSDPNAFFSFHKFLCFLANMFLYTIQMSAALQLLTAAMCLQAHFKNIRGQTVSVFVKRIDTTIKNCCVVEVAGLAISGRFHDLSFF